MIEYPTLEMDSEKDHLLERYQTKIFYERLKCLKRWLFLPKKLEQPMQPEGGGVYENEIIFNCWTKISSAGKLSF